MSHRLEHFFVSYEAEKLKLTEEQKQFLLLAENDETDVLSAFLAWCLKNKWPYHERDEVNAYADGTKIDFSVTCGAPSPMMAKFVCTKDIHPKTEKHGSGMALWDWK